MPTKNSISYCDIMLIAGTRPELIKLSELNKQLNFCKTVYVYTGQHFSKNMKDVFFDELESQSDVDLECNTSDVEVIKEKMVKLIVKLKPTIVIVYGDTNSTLAGALAGKDTKTKVIHLESGLRSFDSRMPEERNRILVDKISDYLLCPTAVSKEFLRLEGITKNVFVTGNLIVDVSKKISNHKYPKNFKIDEEYILLTLHRAENADDKFSLKILVKKLNELSKYNIIFPIHPRTKENLKVNNIKIPKNVKIIDPLGYIEFISLLKQAKLILTDSGGIQEEAIILKKPCITLRNTTERWETILRGGNQLFPLMQNNQSLAKVVDEMIRSKIKNQPYGKTVTRRTINVIKKILKECKTEQETKKPIKIPYQR